jgi:hypothetical protein
MLTTYLCYHISDILLSLFSVFCLKAMSLEEVLSDYDSENEVDPEVEDIEERRVCTIYM